MAIASEEGRLQQCLNDNINWDLIKPFLEETKCFSHDELISIWHRSKKKRLKSLMKIISDSDKRKLFVQALKRANHDAGHQRILETLDASDIDKVNRDFVEGLCNAFEQCGCRKVTITQLANKYIELYTIKLYNNMLKKCRKKSLKQFLKAQSNYFAVDKNDNVSLKRSYQSNSKSNPKTANSLTLETAEHVESLPTSIPPHSKSIIIHFTYGERFPKTIQYKDIESLKGIVFEILSDKIANCTPIEVKYKCGSEWYLLEKAETLESILTNPNEMYVQATPEECTQSLQFNPEESVTASLEKDTIPTISKHCDHAETGCEVEDQSLETSDEIRKKGDLADVINVSIDYLQRSLVILIRLVLLRLYGADWLDHFKKALPRKHKNDLDDDVKEITEISFACQPADRYLKFMQRAKHKGSDTFSSTHIECNFSVDFKELSKSVLNIRNLYSHKPTYEIIAVRFQNDFAQILKMSKEIVYWVEKEDGDEEDITNVKHNFQCIKHKYRGYESETCVESSQILKGLLKLNFNQYGYMLFSALNAEEIDISHSQLGSLSYIPWSTVIDFDVHSKYNGLFSAMCEFDEINHCAKTKYLSPKKYIKPISYTALGQSRFVRDELIKPGYIPWIFSHGDVEDKSNEVCPLSDHKKYIHEVQDSVLDAVEVISKSITKQKPVKSKPIVSLVLCYGTFACNSKKLPYPAFLDDFEYLCKFLLRKSESVVVLTDNIETCLLLERTEIKVFKFPLTIFCEALSSDPLIAKDFLPFQLITSHGWRENPFAEEDFDFVHKNIAENEMRQLVNQTMTEIRQNADTNEETEMTHENELRHKISKELRVNFYKCEMISFASLNNGDAITREEEPGIITELKELLDIRKGGKTEPAMYILYHTTGTGATTLARKIVWQLRNKYPCVILKSNYTYSDKNIENTSRILKELHEYVNLPILMLIDEEPSFQTVPQLTKQVQIDVIPMVFLYVQRYVGDIAEHHNSSIQISTSRFFLPSGLTKIDAYNFQEKLCIAFSEEKVTAGFKKIEEMMDLMIAPKEGDEVQASIAPGAACGIITKVRCHSDFFEVKVKWAHKSSIQWRAIGENCKYQRVYLKNISNRTTRIFKTFQLYGIMCLGEEFRKPIKCHVKSCLEKIPLTDLHILAHLSILFAFKVVQVLPSRCFQQLCCELMERTATGDFDLNTYIYDSAKEFAIVDALGWFRVVHSIIAEEILDFFLSASGTALSQLICEFLENMIFDSEYGNTDVDLITRNLLYYREIELSGRYTDKKPFSNMILAVEEREGKQDAIKVFQCALPLINNHHAYSHLARYLSKRVSDFKEALQVVDKAENLAGEDSETGFVLNVKGDIYREKLKLYLNNSDNQFNWTDTNESAYLCRSHACEAYQRSYKANPSIYPLHGEMSTHLLLLKKFKSCVNDFTTSAAKNLPITDSIAKGYATLQKLKDFINHGDGGKDADSDSKVMLEAEFYGIVESKSEKQVQILRQYIDDDDVKSLNKVYTRRWLLKLYKTQLERYSPDLNYLLGLSEDNLTAIGYNDIDMQSWVSLVRKLPEGGDMKKIQDKLDKWKHRISSIGESQMLVNLYLAIFYFIKLISCDETEAYQVLSGFKTAYQKVQKESTKDKSRLRIREWLQAAGRGFQCLRSDHQDRNKMQRLQGKVVTLSKQKHLQVSWKGIYMVYKSEGPKPLKLRDGQQVRFAVGFSLNEVRAIAIEAISSTSSVVD